VFGFHDSGIARAKEASHGAKARALGNERFHECLRLCARLPPDDRVPWPNYTTEVHHGSDYG
jgi:hypothetical protein